jgi:hypothetical protein
MDRQLVLLDPGKRFEFIITELGLRWRVGPAWHSHGFVIFGLRDGTAVHLETLTTGINVFDPGGRRPLRPGVRAAARRRGDRRRRLGAARPGRGRPSSLSPARIEALPQP